MPRKRLPFIRESAVRDARLVIIATEDAKATVAYFEGMISSSAYQSSRVHVEVLTRDTNASSPTHILEQLNKWRDEYQIEDDDEFWLVIDVDQWGDKKLSQTAQECHQKGILLAVSNPAIELWFLLHLDDVQSYDPKLQYELFENAKVSATRTRLEQAILKLVGRHNKGNFNIADYLDHIPTAIERARKQDVNPDDRWPQQLGTRVYLVVESIINSRKKI